MLLLETDVRTTELAIGHRSYSSAQNTNFLVGTSVPPANERTWRPNHNSVGINYQNGWNQQKGDLPSYRQKQPYGYLDKSLPFSFPNFPFQPGMQQQQQQPNFYPRYTVQQQSQPVSYGFQQQVICQRCGRNHPTSQCIVDPNILCYSCGLPGHTSSICCNLTRS